MNRSIHDWSFMSALVSIWSKSWIVDSCILHYNGKLKREWTLHVRNGRKTHVSITKAKVKASTAEVPITKAKVKAEVPITKAKVKASTAEAYQVLDGSTKRKSKLRLRKKSIGKLKQT